MAAYQELVRLWSSRYPKGTSERFKRMDALSKLQDDSIYDILPHPFEKEENGVNNPIPLHERRPNVRYMLPKIIVDHTSSLTFGDAHAPAVRIAEPSEDMDPKALANKHEQFERIIEALELDAVMIEAMKLGAVGSVAVILRVLDDGYPWLDIIEGKYCIPHFDVKDPRKLVQLDQIYSVTAEDLRLAGYKGDYKPDKIYYIKITYTTTRTVVSMPLVKERYERLGEKDDDQKVIVWVKDEERSYSNPLSFMPVVWIRNLPCRTAIDGDSTFGCVADFTIQISYLLSQIGRGYYYTADPILAEESSQLSTGIPLAGTDPDVDTEIRRSPARMLKVDGKVSVLEISGEGLRGASEHVKMLREYALEVLSGMKSDSDNSKGVQSGRALHYLHQALVWLAEKFRVSYGTRGYLAVLRMVFQGIADGDIVIPNVEIDEVDPKVPLRLVWPQWSTPSGADMLAEITALATAAGSTPQFPVKILPISVIAQKAASVVGISDQNRVAAELEAEMEEKPPLTAADANDTKVEIADKAAKVKATQAKARSTAK